MDRSRLILAVLLLALGFATQRLTRIPVTDETALLLQEAVAVPDGFVSVAEAVDGDTLRLADGSLVRYIGVDTPETVHPKKKVQCFGKEASNFNASLVEGKAVRLERDISDTDKYGRLLRYVYLEDGTLVNLALVADGFATVVTYPPDIAHTAEFQAAQAEARAAGRGLWSACR
jgi:micrococcal nuclease